MGVEHKIAAKLSTEHQTVVSRGLDKLPLQRGDRVVDAGYAYLPVKPSDGYGNIVKTSGRYALVAWDNGDVSEAPRSSLIRVARQYVPTPHDSAYELPIFHPKDHVILGNGNHGRVLAEVVGPTGFKSFSVEITGSVRTQDVGRKVFATQNGMVKVSGLEPDIVAAILCPVKGMKAVVGCELAASLASQEIGLQKYNVMPEDRGMLFPYDPPRPVTFHMGSVSFPIDVLFISENGTIQKIEANQEPGYDSRWRSIGKVAAVLEVNGGFCQARGIDPGMRVSIGNPKLAQETFDPARTDSYLYQSPATSRPNPSERFMDRQMPDQILEDSQPLDGEHYELQTGYDPVTFHDDPAAPNMRSGGWTSPLQSSTVGEYETKQCGKCRRDTIHYKGVCRACGTPSPVTPPAPRSI